MYATENGTHAEILPPAVKKEKHEGGYKGFKEKQDDFAKVVLEPH